VPLDAIPSHVVEAVVATEDRRFWRHPGIDPFAVLRAAASNWREGQIVSGASTLTMQVARLLRAGGPTARRGWGDKIAEAHLALRLELRWSKRRILEAWLNRVSFGNDTRGLEAAARLYFGKPARDLTRAEGAFLVGLPQSPSRYNPFRHPDRARERQRQVLDALVAAGRLDAGARSHLAALPLDLRDPASAFRAPHFTAWVLATTPRDVAGPGRTELRTTLDGELQAAVEGLVRTRVAALASEAVTNAAAVVLHNATGDVRAYAGSADFWDEAAAGQNDGVRMLRQPGSTLKPFLYARALEDRSRTAASVLADIELHVPAAGGAFSPTNYDGRFHGPTPLRTALASSYNVPAVRLARAMGPDRLLDALHAAGFASLDRAPAHYGVGLALGNGEVQLLELARAYAGLARGGTLPPVRPIRWARTVAGDTLRPSPAAPAPMGLSPPTVHLIRDILSDPQARSPAFGTETPLTLPFPAAAKTGTSKDYRDNWTVGFTPTHTVAVWVGNFDGSPTRRVSGVTGAGPLYHAILQEIGPGGRFERPAGLVDRAVCPASGARPATACPAPRTEIFAAGTAPVDTCTVHRTVRIDVRTGRHAAADTPPPSVRRETAAVYPEVYHAWMRAHSLPLPPAPPLRSTGSPGAPLVSDRLHIQHPVDGSRFLLDPVLRRSHQRIHFRGAAPATWQDVHWTVDGERIEAAAAEASWQLQEGVHVVRLHAVRPDGRRVHSPPVPLHVHPLEAGPAWATRPPTRAAPPNEPEDGFVD
jgi:penicillin-binding protein 1C